MQEAQKAAKIERYRGCLIGQAVGDALGFTSENLSRERIRTKFGRLTDYHVRPSGAFYTDDTQLAIMLAETLLEAGEFNCRLFRQKLVCISVKSITLSGAKRTLRSVKPIACQAVRDS